MDGRKRGWEARREGNELLSLCGYRLSARHCAGHIPVQHLACASHLRAGIFFKLQNILSFYLFENCFSPIPSILYFWKPMCWRPSVCPPWLNFSFIFSISLSPCNIWGELPSVISQITIALLGTSSAELILSPEHNVYSSCLISHFQYLITSISYTPVLDFYLPGFIS